MEETNLTQLEMQALFGQLHLDLAVWQKRCAILEQRLAKYEPQTETPPKLEVVKEN